VAAAAAMLIFIALAAGAIRLLLNWTTQQFAFAIGFELSRGIYSRVLHQPYSYHLNRNSAQFLSALQKVQFVINMVLVPGIQAFTALVISLCILAALLYVDAGIAIGTALGFGLIYGAVSIATRTRVRRNSRLIADLQTSRIKLIQESIGGIRDVIIERAQNLFVGLFERDDRRLRRAQAINHFIATSPRFVLEAASVVLVALIAIVIAGRPGGLVAALPMLAAFAVGAQRLLPQAQQVYSAFSTLSGSQASLADILDLLDGPRQPELEPGADVPEIRFEREIALRGVGFTYPASDSPALHNIDLVIPRGSRIGFVGATGSGKSTLVDLLMGLLRPTTGAMAIDGLRLDDAGAVGWQSHIAHVPQSIYLSDSSVAQNIAFGCPPEEVDRERIRAVAGLARLDSVVEELPDGYDTEVGEKGVRLSGGQRQRIGIARALYQEADVLVLDEATSALDETTESAVMESIAELKDDLTVLVVAHRLSTLRMCDIIVRLDQGRIVEMGDFASVIGPTAIRSKGGTA
jgi:ATP-binding cassette, subfamily B, bacterial PglK